MTATGETYVVAARHHDAEEDRRRAARRLPIPRCPRPPQD